MHHKAPFYFFHLSYIYLKKKKIFRNEIQDFTRPSSIMRKQVRLIQLFRMQMTLLKNVTYPPFCLWYSSSKGRHPLNRTVRVANITNCIKLSFPSGDDNSNRDINRSWRMGMRGTLYYANWQCISPHLYYRWQFNRACSIF